MVDNSVRQALDAYYKRPGSFNSTSPSTMGPRERVPREALSLSAVNTLAANPPQYPHSTTHHEDLTLYISRVPGTRDIILSTMKPHKKNVTQLDIANSLYYIHFNLPEDELIAARQQALETGASPRTSIESTSSPIRRKPLPGAAKVTGTGTQETSPSSATSISGHGPSPLVEVERIQENLASSIARMDLKPQQQPTQGATNSNPHPLPQPPGSGETERQPAVETRPHPLPPIPSRESVKNVEWPEEYRPNPMFAKPKHAPEAPPTVKLDVAPVLPPRRPSSELTAISRKPVGPRSPGVPSSTSSTFPPPPSYESSQQQQNGPITSIPDYMSPSSQPTSPTKLGRTPTFFPFSVSIIRRDPTSHIQTNVGKVWSWQTNIPTPDLAHPDLDPAHMPTSPTHAGRQPKITVHLETSGYAKYRGMPSMDAYRQGLGGGQSGSQENVLHSGGGFVKEGEGGFTRQVVMAYAQGWGTKMKEAFRRHGRSRSAQDVRPEGVVLNNRENDHPRDLAPPRVLPFHARADSTGSVDSLEEGAPSAMPATEPGPGTKPKGYMFLSPWDGRCEFRTGNAGRSLKLRHVLDTGEPPAKGFRSLAPGGTRSRGVSVSSGQAIAKPVSELRFNLPAPAIWQSAKDNGGGELISQINKLLRVDKESSSDDDEEGEVDIGLGREKAGGGSTGARAKLGKLIVHDEGLKMLDLVVAANVGVWWTVWERSWEREREMNASGSSWGDEH